MSKLGGCLSSPNEVLLPVVELTAGKGGKIWLGWVWPRHGAVVSGQRTVMREGNTA
jgi:hypothetical protein